MISTMELHVLHLLVDVVALGEGVGGTPCFSIHCACLSELCRCVYTAWVHIQHITYWLPWLFVFMLSCCSPPPPPPSHTHKLACTCTDWLNTLKGGGRFGEKEKERETAVLHTDTGNRHECNEMPRSSQS